MKFRDYLKKLRQDQIVRFLVGCFVLTSLGSLVINHVHGTTFSRWWETWLLNLSGDVIGLLGIYLLFEMKLRREAPSQEKPVAEQDTVPITDSAADHAMNNYVARLKQASSRESRQVILDQMKVEGVLPGANLSNLNLQGANLYDCDLRGASFESANLENAYMIEANLQGANLNQANLQNAELSWSNLKGAFLGGANLQGAWMLQANLEEAFLKTSQFDYNTRLPDGTRWSVEAVMQRFCDQRWPGFWRPDPGLFGELPRWYRREESVKRS
ncbi:MAG: pentapeptide repeat-containing protein [Anaerolineae bacterium]|nr:pentapeptide repeat-containing protein [Anaerolineae bacterium]